MRNPTVATIVPTGDGGRAGMTGDRLAEEQAGSFGARVRALQPDVVIVVIGRALQKRAADLPDVPEPTGGGGPQKPEKLSRRRQDTLVDTVRAPLLCRW